MTKALASTRNTEAGCKTSTERQELELEFAALFSDLSDLSKRAVLLNKKLRSSGCRQSAAEVSDVGVLLKSALRILAGRQLELV